jgi:hypothetical protein
MWKCRTGLADRIAIGLDDEYYISVREPSSITRSKSECQISMHFHNGKFISECDDSWRFGNLGIKGTK